MSKIIKVINNELIEIASYRNPEVVFHNSNNPRHLEPEYDNFESYCDYKKVINPFQLIEENIKYKEILDKIKEYITTRTPSDIGISGNKPKKYYTLSEDEVDYILELLEEIE